MLFLTWATATAQSLTLGEVLILAGIGWLLYRTRRR